MIKRLPAIIAILVALILFLGFIGYHYLKRPVVSVVMLTYQRADMVKNAIDSILAQTYPNFELIIINDGSTDNTRDVINKYTDKRIRYYENDKNRGITYSRNRASLLARGKYVMIMDDDDVALLDRIEKQVKFLEAHDDVTVLAGQIVGLPRIPLTHDEIASGLIQWNNFGNANVMYRKSFVDDNQIRYDEKLQSSEDWDFWLSILFKGGVFAAIQDDVVYRNGMSVKYYTARFDESNVTIYNKVGAFFSSSNPDSFYEADACAKLKMIALKNIFMKEYLEKLLQSNCL